LNLTGANMPGSAHSGLVYLIVLRVSDEINNGGPQLQNKRGTASYKFLNIERVI